MAKKRGKRRSAAKVSNMTAKSSDMCMHQHCGPKCMGLKKLLLGVLVLLNVSYAWLDWASFVGWALVVIGVLKLFMPVCRMCHGR